MEVAGTLGFEVAGTLGLEVAGILGFDDVAGVLARVDATLPVFVLMILELPPVDATSPVLVLMILVADGGTTAWSHL